MICLLTLVTVVVSSLKVSVEAVVLYRARDFEYRVLLLLLLRPLVVHSLPFRRLYLRLILPEIAVSSPTYP